MVPSYRLRGVPPTDVMVTLRAVLGNIVVAEVCWNAPPPTEAVMRKPRRGALRGSVAGGEKETVTEDDVHDATPRFCGMLMICSRRTGMFRVLTLVSVIHVSSLMTLCVS